MSGLKSRLARLQKAVEGDADSIELTDGSRYFFEPGEAWKEVFRHGSDSLEADYRGKTRPSPPEILKAVAQAKNRRAAVEKLYAPGTHPFNAYDMEELVEHCKLIPRSFLAGHSYEESLAFFAKKNKGEGYGSLGNV
jgi:hypothetical protein